MKPQQLHREMDPRVPRSVMLALSGALVIVACALAVVGLRMQSVHLGYRLDAVRAERAELSMLLRQLQVELATQRSPARIESRARDLGLIMPTREQVRLAREFVPGDSGVAAAQQVRVEASLR
ncbi:MAG TPA: cell division protein FtsL [Candidatus Acidoferrum sp.]|nr:cell division protein FtsL [Candidatus Acidoferrum sp.]